MGRLAGQQSWVETVCPGTPGALIGLAFSLSLSLSKAAVPAHRKHAEVSGQRWATVYLSLRPGTSGQEGHQPRDSTDSPETGHAALQVTNPTLLCCLLSLGSIFLPTRLHSAFQGRRSRRSTFPLSWNSLPISKSLTGDLLLILPTPVQPFTLESSLSQPSRGNHSYFVHS